MSYRTPQILPPPRTDQGATMAPLPSLDVHTQALLDGHRQEEAVSLCLPKMAAACAATTPTSNHDPTLHGGKLLTRSDRLCAASEWWEPEKSVVLTPQWLRRQRRGENPMTYVDEQHSLTRVQRAGKQNIAAAT
ncbi:Hypothetical predicted protein [Pelobates cultripes]|uniref:Uncharacterized protein n=1 Tax=Pelobates cultripes TaxID=61616 RepID=A0AAD1R5F5_PELCU|nr:Hypothetical predicted protein [Pelobates cultripes]